MAKMRTQVCNSIGKTGIIYLMCTSLVCADNNNSSQKATETTDGSAQMTALEESMDPFFKMTNIFLDLVKPESKSWIIEDLSEQSSIDIGYITDNWQKYAKDNLGYAICLAVGIVFVVFMPLVGCIICCCRCCGRCGGHVDEHEGKRSKCSRLVCGTLLFMFTTFMLVGTVLTFVTNEMIWEQTSKPEQGIMYDLVESLQSVENFKKLAIDDVEDVGMRVNNKVDQVINIVNDLPDRALDKLDEIVDATDILDEATKLANKVQSISSTLTNVKTFTNKLKTGVNDLDTELTNIKDDMSGTLSGCGSLQTQCDTLKSKVSGLDTIVNFNQAEFNVDTELAKVQDIVNNNLTGLIDSGKMEFEKVAETVENSIKNDVKDVEAEGNKVKADVDSSVKDLVKQLEDISLQSSIKSVNDQTPDVEKYGTYRKYGGIGVGCALIIVSILYYLGLLFGCCGEPAYDDAGAFNRGTGANLLMGGVVWSFMFSWILMLLVVILFSVGGLMYTEGCRPLSDLGSNQQTLDSLQTVMENLDDSLKDSDYSVSKIIMSCRNDSGIYAALDLQKQVNLSYYLDLDRYDLKSKLDELESASFDIGTVKILSDDTRQELMNLKAAGLQDINFNKYTTELGKDISTEDLSALATQTDDLADAIQSENAGKATALRGNANDMRAAQTGNVQAIINDKQSLSTALTDLQNAISGTKPFDEHVQDLINAFDSTEASIQTQGNIQLKQALTDEANAIYDMIKKFIDDLRVEVETELVNCRPLYVTVNDFISNSVCRDTLQPFNAFWFSVGWVVSFFLPSLIVALVLNAEYRKTDAYEATDNKSFDDPYDHRKNQRAGRGHQNTAYEREDYNSSRSAQRNPNYPTRDFSYRNGTAPNRGGGDSWTSGHMGAPAGGYRPPPTTTPPNPPHYYKYYKGTKYNNRPPVY